MRRGELARLLAAHVPADEVEGQHVLAVLRRLAAPQDPWSRSSLTVGHVTASAFVLSPALDSVLLVHHRVLDRWLQPGGHVESDDANIDAASLREVLEECGVSGLTLHGGRSLDVDVHAIPANPRRGEGAHLHFDVRRWWVAGSLDLVADAVEVHAAAWVPLDEVSARSDGSVVDAVRRLHGGVTPPDWRTRELDALVAEADALDAAEGALLF